jgi:hypothetical protein
MSFSVLQTRPGNRLPLLFLIAKNLIINSAVGPNLVAILELLLCAKVVITFLQVK